MSWEHFIFFAVAAALLWIAGAVLAFVRKDTAPAFAVSLTGTAVLFAFMVLMWVTLGRPPLRTMGETRLWYSFFLSIVGAVTYRKWHFSWLLAYGVMMALMFLCINIFKPEIHTAELMPALRSIWFVPHVTVYMFSYALLAAAMILSLVFTFRPHGQDDMVRCDVLVRIGWAFLSMGMVMGALWAKDAWGDWWAWDPKETWALATWLGYLLYLHARPLVRDRRMSTALLVLCFLMLCMTWFGVNYLPSAKGASIHTY